MDLEQAVADLAPRLLRYCTASTRQAGLSEDIAQEALVALVQRWRRHGPPNSVEAFVFSIARRRATRALLRQRLLAPLVHLAGQRDGGPTPERIAIARNERDTTLAAIGRLRSRDREALLLVAVAGLDTAAASSALGISPSAFKVRTLRARRRLAALMGKVHADAR
jgi:RNA polymerase sigma factor (sigma-70 family)